MKESQVHVFWGSNESPKVCKYHFDLDACKEVY